MSLVNAKIEAEIDGKSEDANLNDFVQNVNLLFENARFREHTGLKTHPVLEHRK
jgi:hypothetical protein